MNKRFDFKDLMRDLWSVHSCITDIRIYVYQIVF